MRKMSFGSLGIVLLLCACSSIPATVPTAIPAAASTPTFESPIATETLQDTDTPEGLPIVLITGTPTAVATGTPGPAPIGSIALAHIKALAWGIGPRPSGSPAEADAADYILAELQKLGYDAHEEPFRFTNEQGQEIQSANVVAVKPGVSERQVIVGAHYDSVSDGTGADDNASGVGVLLEAATRIKDIQTPYTVRFVAFGSEEPGEQGSAVFVKKLTPQEIQETVLMVNLDSLLAGDIPYVYGDAGEKGKARDWLMAQARAENFLLETQPGENKLFPAGTTGDWSDHAPFQKAGIPYAYFEATNWSLGEKDGYTQVDVKFGEQGKIWHTQYDTLDYIEKTFPGRIDDHLKLFTTLLTQLLKAYQG
jgi:alkaline phosphatase isozyme conversion protein